jgi:hypothetical protein
MAPANCTSQNSSPSAAPPAATTRPEAGRATTIARPRGSSHRAPTAAVPGATSADSWMPMSWTRPVVGSTARMASAFSPPSARARLSTGGVPRPARSRAKQVRAVRWPSRLAAVAQARGPGRRARRGITPGSAQPALQPAAQRGLRSRHCDSPVRAPHRATVRLTLTTDRAAPMRQVARAARRAPAAVGAPQIREGAKSAPCLSADIRGVQGDDIFPAGRRRSARKERHPASVWSPTVQALVLRRR